jgi:hypothetical protein
MLVFFFSTNCTPNFNFEVQFQFQNTCHYVLALLRNRWTRHPELVASTGAVSSCRSAVVALCPLATVVPTRLRYMHNLNFIITRFPTFQKLGTCQMSRSYILFFFVKFHALKNCRGHLPRQVRAPSTTTN